MIHYYHYYYHHYYYRAARFFIYIFRLFSFTILLPTSASTYLMCRLHTCACASICQSVNLSIRGMDLGKLGLPGLLGYWGQGTEYWGNPSGLACVMA